MRESLKSVLLFIFFLFVLNSLMAQDENALPEEETAVPEVGISIADPVEEKESGSLSVFLDKRLIFALSATEGGFGFGGTANGQYIFPFHLGVGLEAGYYSFRSDIDQDGVRAVGGFSLIPIYATVSFNIPILENFYITPILKGGGAFARARINGWLGGNSFAPMFEGGVRVKAYMRGGLLIQGGIFYTGMIEASGLFSILSIGMGFGL
ncbi:hypothetical protein [Spirochaeta isovalerica]|uniref:Uncharacterized protein n=1 Tax=Spirochaeta isovalerica TaxID=150 RepID=A0A841R6M0_9SPIO|nr:hypothetical protein [Spirochaeta isovalerica]MBB6478418.1 hypothetical protein [Spirochaeta isovalerica]